MATTSSRTKGSSQIGHYKSSNRDTAPSGPHIYSAEQTTPQARRVKSKSSRGPQSSPTAAFRSHVRASSSSSASSAAESEYEASGTDTAFGISFPTQISRHGSLGQSSTNSVQTWLQDTDRAAAGPPPRSRASRDSYGWDDHSYLAPSLRVSASSTSYIGTPPLTPTDTFYHNSRSSPVVVAAPISDVGTMDALVDGMNGLDGENLFSSPGLTGKRRSSRTSIRKTSYTHEPPLPNPPPGVTLSARRSRRARESDEDEEVLESLRVSQHKTSSRRPTPARANSASTIGAPATSSHAFSHTTETKSTPRQPNPSIDEIIRKHTSSVAKTPTPSISEIIRKHTPPHTVKGRKTPQLSRAPSFIGSVDNGTVHEEREDGLNAVREMYLPIRASMDSIAAEVQQSLRVPSQLETSPQLLPTTPTMGRQRAQSTFSDSVRSIGSSSTHEGAPSLFSLVSPPRLDDDEKVANPYLPAPSNDPIVSYLRSPRITTLLKLKRTPHASPEQPLTVSLSDLGDEHGFPLVVFLGLGCVRHVMGLYDEMAQLLGLRIIAVDRWGMGRTDTPPAHRPRGIPEWSYVMEEVLDHLGVHRFSVLAHSAGAPYALSFANRLSDRVQGEICLLAPWVGGGENSGYKWLKYVPNGILKTAQAAEWKLQAWMIGKPPKVAFRGIGFDVNAPIASGPSMVSSVSEGVPRPSIGSGGFSDYDDLQDFDGRFDSRSTLGRPSTSSRTKSTPFVPGKSGKPTPQGPPPSGFFSRFRKSSTSSKTQGSLSQDQQGGSRLRGLRSVGSFKGRSGSGQSKTPSIASVSTSSIPALPSCDLGPEAFAWLSTQDGADMVTDLPPAESYSNHSLPRSHTRQRSVSHSVKTASMPSLPSTLSPISAPPPSLPPPSPISPISPFAASSAHQAALANALIAASHAEAARGVHPDLLQILNHSGRPWGFSYATYPHPVHVWYGDRDEKIAEGAVRWMERTMGPSLGHGRGGCTVKVVRGADHALMYNSMVVIEALEQIRESWR